ncbi:hypothetical protein LINPERPRIM_LOCUS28747 [Linum perenne]
MEDCNLMAADCMVLSFCSCCSCPCLLLQLLIFLFLELPRRMLHATMQSFCINEMVDAELGRKSTSTNGDHRGGTSTDEEDRSDGEDCIEETERVLEECYGNGEFGFGSFWRKEVMLFNMSSSSSSSSCPSSTCSSCSSVESSTSTANEKKKKKKKEELGLRVVQFDLVEIVHCLSYSSYDSDYISTFVWTFRITSSELWGAYIGLWLALRQRLIDF